MCAGIWKHNTDFIFLNAQKTYSDYEYSLFCEASSTLKVVDGYVYVKTGAVKTMRYKYMPIRMAQIQNTDSIKCQKEYRATGILIHYQWNAKRYNPFGR